MISYSLIKKCNKNWKFFLKQNSAFFCFLVDFLPFSAQQNSPGPIYNPCFLIFILIYDLLKNRELPYAQKKKNNKLLIIAFHLKVQCFSMSN